MEEWKSHNWPILYQVGPSNVRQLKISGAHYQIWNTTLLPILPIAHVACRRATITKYIRISLHVYMCVAIISRTACTCNTCIPYRLILHQVPKVFNEPISFIYTKTYFVNHAVKFVLQHITTDEVVATTDTNTHCVNCSLSINFILTAPNINIYYWILLLLSNVWAQV